VVKICVATILATTFTAGCAATPPPPSRTESTPPAPIEHRGARSGVKQQIWWYTYLDPKCELVGYPEIILTVPPNHGSAVAEHGEQYPGYPQTNVRSVCNSKRVPATNLYYQSNPDFRGKDSLTFKMLSPDGAIKTVSVEIEVL
jgi:hypothetical protein